MNDKNSYEPEIDFKKLPKSPLRLFGWIFPYYVVLFVVFGIFFVKHMNYSSFNTVPAIYSDSLIINADVQMKKGGIMPAVDLNIISNPSAELISSGKILFATNCASCHGTEGKGDGVAAAALNPKPRNFHETEGWKNGRKFSELYKTLQKGIAGGGMVAYEFISVSDRIAIIQFVRTLSNFPEVTPDEITDLDATYALSKGEATPNNITLEMAAKNISEESTNFKIDVNSFLEKVAQNENKNIVDVFNTYAFDKEKIAAVFKRDFANNRDIELFIDRLIASPTANGFKPNVVDLSKEQLIQLFNILVKATS